MSEPKEKIITDRTWELYAEIGRAERHFNQLEHQYRLLASTWLLATFAAVGYILINVDASRNDWLGFYKELVIVAIAVSGAIGITLTWVLDLKVYQQLLHCFFLAALELEDLPNTWLPPIRHNMRRTQEHGTVVLNVAWFYVGCITVLLVTGGFFLRLWLDRLVQTPASWGVFVATLVITCIWAFTIRHKSVSGRPANLEHRQHL
jgi:hypothetical protein